jgi:hypothetical protein
VRPYFFGIEQTQLPNGIFITSLAFGGSPDMDFGGFYMSLGNTLLPFFFGQELSLELRVQWHHATVRNQIAFDDLRQV